MKKTAATTLLVCAALSLGGCATPVVPPPAPTPREPLAPSPRLIIGRVISIDAERGFAIIELGADAPASALAEGGELIARSFGELRETGRLIASRYLRGRTLGTTVKSGRPSVGDEVVWTAP